MDAPNIQFKVSIGLVPENTVHRVNTYLLFVTHVRSTFDFAIATYTTTLFISYFIYFTLQVYPRTRTAGDSNSITHHMFMIETVDLRGPCNFSIGGRYFLKAMESYRL